MALPRAILKYCILRVRAPGQSHVNALPSTLLPLPKAPPLGYWKCCPFNVIKGFKFALPFKFDSLIGFPPRVPQELWRLPFNHAALESC